MPGVMETRPPTHRARSFEIFSFANRVPARNRNWVPKIEGYLRSGRICFVVVGAGHSMDCSDY
jgi:hypothetical protein